MFAKKQQRGANQCTQHRGCGNISGFFLQRTAKQSTKQEGSQRQHQYQDSQRICHNCFITHTFLNYGS